MLGKVLEKIIVRRLSEMVVRFCLLPEAENALYWLLERINVGQYGKIERGVVSVLSLDVSGAFNNVSHPRLIHNLKKRRIDPQVVKWVESFLGDRRTTICLAEETSELIAVNTGIPQGSPLSLYLFFNADLIEDCYS